jgi:tRNA-dihydrouridine synthase
MKSFWHELKKPISVLAPMEDVTDVVFREIVAEAARPAVFFTEFTNCDGLFSKGREFCIDRLAFTPNQHPIVAQLWGATPMNVKKAAELVRELGFDGIDLNMGCPHKNIVKLGGGADMIRHPDKAKDIILAAKEGACDLPVSVKTRIGYSTPDTENWLGFLLEQNLAVLTVHGRVAKQMSNGEADWNEIAKSVKLRNAINPETLVIGNGDIKDYADGAAHCAQYGTDGFMIGRGIFSNLWAFDKTFDKANKTDENQERQQKLLLQKYLEHAKAYLRVWKDTKGVGQLKHFAKMYIKSKAVRERVYASQAVQELIDTLASLQ